jgi:hypothetical protein
LKIIENQETTIEEQGNFEFGNYRWRSEGKIWILKRVFMTITEHHTLGKKVDYNSLKAKQQESGNL